MCVCKKYIFFLKKLQNSYFLQKKSIYSLKEFLYMKYTVFYNANAVQLYFSKIFALCSQQNLPLNKMKDFFLKFQVI